MLVCPRKSLSAPSRTERSSPVAYMWADAARNRSVGSRITTHSEGRLRRALGELRKRLIDPDDVGHVPLILSEAGVRSVLGETSVPCKPDGLCT